MQLDKTRIAIRERSVVDTMDLALHVLRAHAWPLFVMMGLGAAPLAVANYFLIGWMLQTDLDAVAAGEMVGQVPRYIWTMTVLVVIEAPLASSFATSYLGQAVFLERPHLGAAVRNVLEMRRRVAWCQLLLRGLLPALLLVLVIDRDSSFSNVEGLLLLLFLLVCLRRALRPFLNEIVLLEHLPLHAAAAGTMTVVKRNVMLHGPNGGDLIYRWLVAACVAILLVVGLLGAIVSLQGVFLDAWTPGGMGLFQIGLPAAMWLVVGFISVARFLNYLDVRIRLEGWEVELRMRAEATRLVGVLS